MKKLHSLGKVFGCDFFALKYLIIEHVGLSSNLVWIIEFYFVVNDKHKGVQADKDNTILSLKDNSDNEKLLGIKVDIGYE